MQVRLERLVREQMPPFWQGFDWQMSMTTSQNLPVTPAWHWHVKPTDGSEVQVALFLQGEDWQ